MDLDEVGAAQLRRYAWLRGVNDPVHQFDEYPGGELQKSKDVETLLEWAMSNLPCIPAPDELKDILKRRKKA